MDIGTVVTIIATNAGLIYWLRTDMKDFMNKIDGWKEEINKEMKDFHVKLEKQEAEFKGKMEKQDAEFRGTMARQDAEFRGIMAKQDAEFKAHLMYEHKK